MNTYDVKYLLLFFLHAISLISHHQKLGGLKNPTNMKGVVSIIAKLSILMIFTAYFKPTENCYWLFYYKEIIFFILWYYHFSLM